MSPVLRREEGAKHMLQKGWEVKKQRVEFVCSKWFSINEYLAYKEINCTNVMELKMLENMCLKD
jgi:hypothetical protein